MQCCQESLAPLDTKGSVRFHTVEVVIPILSKRGSQCVCSGINENSNLFLPEK